MLLPALLFAALVIYLAFNPERHPAATQFDKGNYTGCALWEIIVLAAVVIGVYVLFIRPAG